ncbi:unnamed protein product [Discula destructiva]
MPNCPGPALEARTLAGVLASKPTNSARQAALLHCGGSPFSTPLTLPAPVFFLHSFRHCLTNNTFPHPTTPSSSERSIVGAVSPFCFFAACLSFFHFPLLRQQLDFLRLRDFGTSIQIDLTLFVDSFTFPPPSLYRKQRPDLTRHTSKAISSSHWSFSLKAQERDSPTVTFDSAHSLP